MASFYELEDVRSILLDPKRLAATGVQVASAAHSPKELRNQLKQVERPDQRFDRFDSHVPTPFLEVHARPCDIASDTEINAVAREIGGIQPFSNPGLKH
jgi:hypothetical protein